MGESDSITAFGLRSQIGQIVLAAIVLAIAILSGVFYFRASWTGYSGQQAHSLATTSEYKGWLIENWRTERVSDITVLSASVAVADEALVLLHTQGGDEPTGSGIDLLELATHAYDYSDIMVATPDGRVLRSMNEDLSHLDPATVALIDSVAVTGEPLFSDFYYCRQCDEIHLDFAGPITDVTGDMIATIILRIDPTEKLYPILNFRHEEADGIESYIVRDNGDGTYSTIRETPAGGFARETIYPSGDTGVVSLERLAASGLEGPFRGSNDIGIEVIAHIKGIEGSRWSIVSAIGREAMMLAYFRDKRAEFIAFTSIILVIILAIGYSYKSKTKRALRKAFRHEREVAIAGSRFKTILYSIGDGVITTDRGGFIREMNHIAEELTGWRESEARGKRLETVFRIINEHTRISVANPVKKVISEGVIVGLANHTLLVSRDGSERPIADSGSPVFDSEGAIEGVVLVFRDHTEEREAERALAEREKMMREIINAAPLGTITYEITEQGSLVMIGINRAGCNILGIEEESVTGKTIEEAFPPLADTDIPGAYKKVIETGMEYHNKHVHYSHGSLNGIFEVSAIRTGVGQVTIFFRDVTEVEKVESMRAETERRLTTLIAHLPGIAYRCSVERAWNMEFISEGCYAITGYRDYEITESRVVTFSDIIVPEYRDFVWQTTMEAIRERETFNLSYPIRTKEGDIRWVSEKGVAVYNSSGKAEALEGFISDVTEEKELIEQLTKAKESAEEMNRLKSRFLANMSHELRTPMNGILGFSELILEERREEEIKSMSSFINKSAHRLMQTLNNILDISRIEAGAGDPDIKEVNLCDLVSESVQIFTGEAERKGLRLELRCNNVPDKIMTDPSIISNIVENLINNALKFTSEGGIEVVVSGNGDTSHNTTIQVCDTGIGIDPKDHSIIFEEFRQASEGDSRNYEGTGLGLSICKRYITLLGGTIELESEPGKGSVFTVTIPSQ